MDGPIAQGCDVLEQLRGHLAAIHGLALRAIIPIAAQDARLVLNLHGDDGAFGRILLAQVRHQGRKGTPIRLQIRLAMGRKHPHRVAKGVDHATETLGGAFDPGRHILHVAVLPGAKPEQHELDAILARHRQEGIDAGPVKATLLGLHLLPVNRDLQRVPMQQIDGTKGRFSLCAIIAAGVAGLASQAKERSAIHDERTLDGHCTASHWIISSC